MSEFVKDVTDAELDELIRTSERPLLVDFYADWCGPCKGMAPSIDALAEEMADEMTVVKVDTDQHKGVMQAMGVRSLPTLIVFKQTKVAGHKVGAMPPHLLKRWVQDTVRPKKGLFAKLFGG